MTDTQSQRFFTQIIDKLPGAVFAVDGQGKVVFCNRRIEELFGLSPERIVGSDWTSLFAADEIEGTLIEDFPAEIEKTGRLEGVTQFLKGDGSRFTGSISASMFSVEKDGFSGWVAEVRDVTEQEDLLEIERISNHLLAASAEIGRFSSEGLPLHTLMERIVSALHLQLDLASTYMYIVEPGNTTAILQVQKELAPEIQRALFKLNLELDFVEKLIALREPAPLGELLDPDLKLSELIRKHGHQHAVFIPLHYQESLLGILCLTPFEPFSETQLSMIHSLGGQAALALGNAKLALDHREAERKYSTVVERANDGIMISQNDKFTFVNKRLADMLDYSVSEMIGMDISLTMDPENIDEIYEHYNKRISGQILQEIYQGRLKSKTEKLIDVEFNACTIQYKNAPASLSFVRDISNRISLQKQVLEQKAMAEFYNDVLTHDINNFCQTMLGHVDILHVELSSTLDETNLKRLDSCKSAVKKISHIIDRVRELMQIQSIGYEGLLPQNLREVLAEAIEIARETYPSEDVRISVKVPKNSFILDNNLVVLIFMNLLTNAIKHNNGKKKAISITVVSDRIGQAPAWRTDVSDNGPGIPLELQRKIFKRFQRFSKIQGKGLGMSIVRALVNKLSGTISIHSNPDSKEKGATISVLLPKA